MANCKACTGSAVKGLKPGTWLISHMCKLLFGVKRSKATVMGAGILIECAVFLFKQNRPSYGAENNDDIRFLVLWRQSFV